MDEYDDLVVVYHRGDWSNMLTVEALVAVCQTETLLLSSSPECNNTSVSVIAAIFDQNCNLIFTLEQTVAYLAKTNNRQFVNDNINLHQAVPSSNIIVSYFPTCFIGTADAGQLEKKYAAAGDRFDMKVTFANGDLYQSTFDDALESDFEITVVCCIISLILLMVFVSNKLVVIMVFFCATHCLVLAAGFSHQYGYYSLSMYGLVVVPILVLVCVATTLTFSHSWNLIYAHKKYVERGNDSFDELLDGVLCQSYQASANSFHVLFGVAFVVGIAISISPIISISQMSSFFLISLVCYYFLFHLLLIPSFVVYAKQFPNFSCYSDNVIMTRSMETEVAQELELSPQLLQLPYDDEEEAHDEHRDVVATSLIPPPSPSCHYSSLSPSKRSQNTSRPAIRSIDMRPLATDRVVKPQFHCTAADNSGDEDDGDDIDFDDDISEFTRESGMYSTYGREAPSTILFQQDNPSLRNQGQRNDQVRDNNFIVRTESHAFDEAKEEENDQCGENNSQESDKDEVMAAQPHPTDSGREEEVHVAKVVPSMHVNLVFGVIVVTGFVIFLVLVTVILKYSTVYKILDDEHNVSDFFRIGMQFKTPFYAFLGSYRSRYMNPIYTNGINNSKAYGSTNKTEVSSGFQVRVCYGLEKRKYHFDSLGMPRHFPIAFEEYVTDESAGLLADMSVMCQYAINHTEVLNLSSRAETEASCLYTQLMNIRSISNTTRTSSLFETIHDWMQEEALRPLRVGVVPASSGNFGPSLKYDLSWLCESFEGIAPDIFDFLERPTVTQSLVYEWERAVESSIGRKIYNGVLPVLITSDSWVSEEVDRYVKQYSTYTVVCIVVGSFVVILLGTRDFALSIIIEVSGIFLILVTVLLHTLVFQSGSEVTIMDTTVLYFVFFTIILSLISISCGLKFTYEAYEINSPMEKYSFRPMDKLSIFYSAHLLGLLFLLIFAKLKLLKLLAEYAMLSVVAICPYLFYVLPVFVRHVTIIELNPVVKYFKPPTVASNRAGSDNKKQVDRMEDVARQTDDTDDFNNDLVVESRETVEL